MKDIFKLETLCFTHGLHLVAKSMKRLFYLPRFDFQESKLHCCLKAAFKRISCCYFFLQSLLWFILQTNVQTTLFGSLCYFQFQTCMHHWRGGLTTVTAFVQLWPKYSFVAFSNLHERFFFLKNILYCNFLLHFYCTSHTDGYVFCYSCLFFFFAI